MPEGTRSWSGKVHVPSSRRVPLIGRIAQFDDPRGIGVIEFGDGRRLDFHCTAITDGSRSIAVGSVVAVEMVAGHLGRLEASCVRPLPGVVVPGSTLETGPSANGAVDHAPATQPVMEVEPWIQQRPVEPLVPAVVNLNAPNAVPVTETDIVGHEVPVTAESPAVTPDGVAGPTPVPSIAPSDATPPAGVPSIDVGASGSVPVNPDAVTRLAILESVEKSAEVEDDGNAMKSLGANFWSPHRTPSAGPPPTWMVPATPKKD